jgi:hypothetical protein
MEPDIPFDPYDLSVWPIASLPQGRAQVRYRFQTRNLEMRNFLVPLSRKFGRLVFVLVTFCLDDGGIISYLIQNGRVRQYTLSEARNEWHWSQARTRFHIAGDEVYQHDEARFFAEENMIKEALGHWDGLRKPPRIKTQHDRRTDDWWNAPRVRDIGLERVIAISEVLEADTSKTRPRRGKTGQHRKR